jgi:5-hydroxyisourate hydrolase-like protein (transthyretin family)
MLVKVTAAGKTRIATYFATDMDVKFTENFGSLKVADMVNGKPLTKVYVKVYAKLTDGSVKLPKDGYTDLRGRFDYASMKTPERQAIQRFAVLILADDHGAVIKEAAPPQQ